jgi:hypothetical protein
MRPLEKRIAMFLCEMHFGGELHIYEGVLPLSLVLCQDFVL